MKTKIVTLLAICLISASAQANDVVDGVVDTLGTKEAFAVCKTADIVTTAVALKSTGLIEANPISHAIMAKVGLLGWIGFSAFLIYMVWNHEKDIPKPVLAALSGVTCGATINNTMLIIQ